MSEYPTSQLDRLAELLARAPLNLVSRGDRPHIRRLHVAEAEAVTAALVLEKNAVCLDLGSGGGLPGLVIAMVRPDVDVTCLDARAKKMEFVEHLARELGLANVAVDPRRAELAARDPSRRGRFGHVVSRAVARCSVVAELSRGFLQPGGRMAMVKGPSYEAELPDAEYAARVLRCRAPKVDAVPAAPRSTWLVTMRAVGPPPDWVPRGNGVPQRQPLGENSR